jgi:general secretion pathway protein G
MRLRRRGDGMQQGERAAAPGGRTRRRIAVPAGCSGRSGRAECSGRTSWGQAGYTLAELVMVAAILASLSLLAMPVVKYTTQRSKEMEMRQDLREMRAAIDEYKRYSDLGLLPVDLGTEGYPKELAALVKGITLVGQVDKKKKFLRRIPVDPMTGKAEWGLRSYQDEPDAKETGGEDVYDVYSLASGVGLNGIAYRSW